MTKDEAKQSLIRYLEDEVRLSTQKWVQKVEEDAVKLQKKNLFKLLQPQCNVYTADQVAAHSSSVVHLPNDEMKGRIIGKEGRNIKSSRNGNRHGICYW